MQETFESREDDPHRAIIISVFHHQNDLLKSEELLEELAELAKTCKIEVIDQIAVRLRENNPRYVLGSGKAEEIVMLCREQKANLIIFDDPLLPSQQRNWEKLAKIQVIDRQEVILNIFADRATTKEAVLQIELAKSQYLLPRMKNAWTHLHRQKGGVGVRGGEGEKQIEIDSRLLRTRIARLKTELKAVSQHRAEQRKRRQRIPIPNAAIVGYTNAGKSSLLNLLTEADVLAEDKLFATLDPTTRKVLLPNKQPMLLTDTVGFVRKLPHGLVEAFKATLEEAVLAKFLIHVVDINSANYREHIETTEEVLKEIGAFEDKPSLLVFNKIDCCEPYMIRRVEREFPNACFVSAHTGVGVKDLIEQIQEEIADGIEEVTLQLPHSRFDLLAMLHRIGEVKSENYEDDYIIVDAALPKKKLHEVDEFLIDQIK